MMFRPVLCPLTNHIMHMDKTGYLWPCNGCTHSGEWLGYHEIFCPRNVSRECNLAYRLQKEPYDEPYIPKEYTIAYTMFNYHLLLDRAMEILHASFQERGRNLFSLKNILGDAFMEENDCNDVLNLPKDGVVNHNMSMRKRSANDSDDRVIDDAMEDGDRKIAATTPKKRCVSAVTSVTSKGEKSKTVTHITPPKRKIVRKRGKKNVPLSSTLRSSSKKESSVDNDVQVETRNISDTNDGVHMDTAMSSYTVKIVKVKAIVNSEIVMEGDAMVSTDNVMEHNADIASVALIEQEKVDTKAKSPTKKKPSNKKKELDKKPMEIKVHDITHVPLQSEVKSPVTEVMKTKNFNWSQGLFRKRCWTSRQVHDFELLSNFLYDTVKEDDIEYPARLTWIDNVVRGKDDDLYAARLLFLLTCSKRVRDDTLSLLEHFVNDDKFCVDYIIGLGEDGLKEVIQHLGLGNKNATDLLAMFQ